MPVPDDLDNTLATVLLDAHATVATAESCTAGMVAARLADRPGSSAYLEGGFVTYSNAAKTLELAVPTELILAVGAVSEEVALAMAHGARRRLDTTYGVSTTGVAGPGGGTPDKPVGRVHVAVSGPTGTAHERPDLPGDRSEVRRATTEAVLRLLLAQVALR